MKDKRLIYLMLSILIGFIIFSGISLVNAQDYLPHKQRTSFDLIVSSNNATQCNWTYIQYPDGSKINYNKVMTKIGNDFNYTINSNNFTQLGSNCMGISCYDGVNYETGSVCREVTPSGFIGTLGFYILILVLSFGIIILGLSLQDAPIVILGSFGLYFIGLYILFYGLVGMKDLTYTWGIGLIILGLAFYISVKSAWELITD
jgi:hypothetical protein